MLKDLVRLTRPPTLAASVVPVAVGAASGSLVRPLSLGLTLDMLVVALLLQIATNMANEYFDFRRGLDQPSSQGIAGVLVSGRMQPRTVAYLSAATYALAFLLGTLLAVARGPVLLALGLASIGLGVLYSGGPRPVSGTPFGELLVFLLMGPLEVLVSEVAASGALSLAGLVASLPVGALVAAILLANNLRDLDQDRAHGRRTLAILLGRERAQALLTGLEASALLVPLLAAAARLVPPTSSLAALAAVTGRGLLTGRLPPNPVPAVARLHLTNGLLLAAGLALGHLLPHP